MNENNRKKLCEYNNMYNKNLLPTDLSVFESRYIDMYATFKKANYTHITPNAITLLIRELDVAYKTAIPIESAYVVKLSDNTLKLMFNPINIDLHNYFIFGEFTNTDCNCLPLEIEKFFKYNTKKYNEYLYRKYNNKLYFASIKSKYNTINLVSSNLNSIFYIYENKHILY